MGSPLSPLYKSHINCRHRGRAVRAVTAVAVNCEAPLHRQPATSPSMLISLLTASGLAPIVRQAESNWAQLRNEYTDMLPGSYPLRKYMVCVAGLKHHIVDIRDHVTRRDGQTTNKQRRGD